MKRTWNVDGESPERFPLDRLIAFAMREMLIDGVEEHGSEVVLLQGARRVRLSHRQASVFLVGMLRGRSWYAGALMESEDAPAETDADEGSPGAQPEASPAEASPAEAAPSEDRGTEAILDALLAYAREAGLIEHFDKNARAAEVTLWITACKSTMPFGEAVTYLFDCVQDHVRAGRRPG